MGPRSAATSQNPRLLQHILLAPTPPQPPLPPRLPHTTAVHTALLLDDILVHIASFLTPGDLYACTLVSTAWRAVFHAFLWHSIAITESHHRPDFLTTLRRNLHLVRSLQWNYTDWWELHHVLREHTPLPPSPALFAPVRTIDPAVSGHRPPILYHPQGRSGSFSSSSTRPGTSIAPKSTSTAASAIWTPSSSGRPIYRAPSLISFPTTTALQGLAFFQDASALRSLVLEGPFELLPLLVALGGQPSRSGNRLSTASMLTHLSLKNTNCPRREVLPTIDLVLRVSSCLEHCSIRTNAQICAATSTTSTSTQSAPSSSSLTPSSFPALITSSSAEVTAITTATATLRHGSIAYPGGATDKEEAENEDETERRPLVLKSLELDIRALTGVQLLSILKQCPDLESFTTTDYGQASPLQDFVDEELKRDSHRPLPSSSFTVLDNIPFHRRSRTSTQQIYSAGTTASATPFVLSEPLQEATQRTTTATPRDSPSKNKGGLINIDADNTTKNIDLVNLLPTFLHNRGTLSVRFGDVALTALQHYCPKLRTLDIGQAFTGKIQSSSLQSFLCSPTAANLRHLRTRGVTLDVEDMADPLEATRVGGEGTLADVHWRCKDLETISIAFGRKIPHPLPPQTANSGIDFQQHSRSLIAVPEEHLPSLDNSMGDRNARTTALAHTSSANMQLYCAWAERTVYKQLSLLIRLRVLDIRQSSFMRFEIGTGVELLASLSNLREFSIAGSEISAGVAAITTASACACATAGAEAGADSMELEMKKDNAMDLWFRQHWPAAEKVIVASRTCHIKTNTTTLGLSQGRDGDGRPLPVERRQSC
ncbi:hypothetical protein BGZ99_002539 [Dissophora globulifera]|uniref:F-box domain-containing protein n=1 Tax=Dissophora globulifera TaxID=979702 RepID=A0A9P6UXH2_9FUNG|nr:hypothetical protein BGZ99_002539 [Dissophora globulifera]